MFYHRALAAAKRLAWQQQSGQAARLHYIAFILLTLLGAGLRLYNLTAQPLRQDELYTAQLVLHGLGMIWSPSFHEHSLPLSNALFWLAGQLGGVSAATLRAVSVAEAMVALVFYARYCGRVIGGWAAVCAVGLFAVAPLAIIYAQDARPYALPSLALVLSLLAYERLRQDSRLANWLLYAACAVLAAQSHYILVPLILAQLLALLILEGRRWRVAAGGAATCVAMAASLAVFSAGAQAETRFWLTVRSSIQFIPAMQVMLSGDGNGGGPLIRALLLGAAAIACAAACADLERWHTTLRHLLRIAAMLAASFVLLPLVGVFVPEYEGRQFQILLPSVFVCAAVGLRWLARARAGSVAAAALLGVICVASALALTAYFQSYHKSAEADAVQKVLARAHPGDVAGGDRPALSSHGAPAHIPPPTTHQP